MKTKQYESHSEAETFALAKDLAGRLKQGAVVCLDGDLGTGKTVFAKGFAKGLGIEEPITSPTFTIVQSYEHAIPFHHFDVYRIADVSELDEIGFEEYIFGDGICLIEWASRIADEIPKDAVLVTITKDLTKSVEYRRILVTCEGCA